MWINNKIFPLEFVLNQYEMYYPMALKFSYVDFFCQDTETMNKELTTYT